MHMKIGEYLKEGFVAGRFILFENGIRLGTDRNAFMSRTEKLEQAVKFQEVIDAILMGKVTLAGDGKDSPERGDAAGVAELKKVEG